MRRRSSGGSKLGRVGTSSVSSCGYLSFPESVATPGSHLSRKVKESPVRFDGLDHGVTEEVDEPAEALRGKGLGSN